MSLEPGSQLLHYRVIRRLGSGGSGDVWEAEDSRLERRVALKLLHGAAAGDPERLERLRREARALAALAHPSIVTVHAIEEADGQLFLVMERVEGRLLTDVLRAGELAPDRLLELALQLTEAVAVAHEHGVVHRDLKPGNVMVTAEGTLKVLDFGLARLLSSVDPEGKTPTAQHLTQTGAALGTWHYMAPEQIRGQGVDARSDVFALGVVLYEMATGNRPFVGASVVEVAEAIIGHEPPCLAEVRRELPSSFSDLVHWCLEKKPRDRPGDARMVHDALAFLLRAGDRGPAVTAGSAGPSRPSAEPAAEPRPSRSSRRRLAVVAALLAVAAVVVLAIERSRANRAPPAAVAVLPFVNMTGEPEHDHLARGLAAGLITRLGQVSGLAVLSRSESWHAADGSRSAAILAKELGVERVVEGEVLGGAEGLGVDVKLTDGPTGRVLWSEHFRGREGAIFELQRQIASGVVRVLAVPLSTEDRRRMARNPTRSLDAYAAYLRGEHFLAQVTEETSPDRAAAQFREALRHDPDFALAHAGLAEAVVRSYEKGADPERLEEAERHVRRALDLDPGLGPARVALARLARAQGRPGSAIEELREVAAGLARPDEAYRELAAGYEQMGELEQAERALRLAVSTGEESWFNWNRLGALLLRQGRYEEARQALQRAGEIAPQEIHWPALNLATLELLQANWEAAVAAFEAVPAPTHDPRLAANLGTAYFFLDRLGEAETLYRRAVRLDPSEPTLRRNLGDLLERQGKEEEAREQFRLALKLVEEQLERTPGDLELRLFGAVYAAKGGLCPRALTSARALQGEGGVSGEDARRLAQTFALCGAPEDALAALETAIASGVARERIAQEDEFRTLREDPRFRKLVGEGEPAATSR